MKKLTLNTRFLVSLAIVLIGLSLGAVAVATSYAATGATLGVSEITTVKADAVADNTYENGWKWTFDVTVPDDEDVIKMKFSDFVSGSNTIPVASNVRIYSSESTNASTTDSAITLSASNVYSGEMILKSDSDKDLTMAGNQIEIMVEVKVPVGSQNGAYTSTYGINSAPQSTTTDPEPDTTAPVITLTGANPQTIEKGSDYVELGATATDNVDTTVAITISTSTVDTSTVGTYTATYNARDAAGNNAVEVTRTINVVDTSTPPQNTGILGTYGVVYTNEDGVFNHTMTITSYDSTTGEIVANGYYDPSPLDTTSITANLQGNALNDIVIVFSNLLRLEGSGIVSENGVITGSVAGGGNTYSFIATKK